STQWPIFHVETFTLPPDDGYPLFITANRYWDDHSTWQGSNGKRHIEDKDAKSGLTLICLHSTSFHKEVWEACLETLFRIVRATIPGRDSVTIREAWSIEAPNHGDSASLNWNALRRPPFATRFGCEGYSRAAHRFLTKGRVPFHERNLVGIGHSLGANAILMLQTFSPSLPFKSLVIVEPMVSPGGDDVLQPLRARLVRASERRRDSWASLDEARGSLPGRVRSMRKGDGKRPWDDRVVEAFLSHGIRPRRNSAELPVTAKFALACTKEQEIVMYEDREGSEAPVKALDKILPTLPIHLVLGEIKDYLPLRVHEMLTGPTSEGKYASVKILPHVGHLIPQEQPDALAEAIAQALCPNSSPRCRL
ncbi:alpha/beta-hydrolase, partial [Coprinellus micaceus]